VKTATLTLTQRESEVAGLVAQGLTNRQIATKLFISERTAEYHIEQIRNKLGFHARTQIAAWVAADQSRPGPDNARPPSALTGGAAGPAPTRRSLRVAVFGLAAAVALTMGGLAAVAFLSRTTRAPASAPGRVVQLDAATSRLTSWSVPLSVQASNLAVGDGAIWSVSYGAKVLTRISPKTLAVLGSYGLSAPPVGITVGGGLVWVATAFGDNALQPFDPKTNQPGQPVPLGSDLALQGIAYGSNSIWVTDKNNNLVYRVDPSTNMVTARIAVGDGPEGIAVDSAAVWVANAVDATISRIDPNSSRVVATIGLVGTPTAIAAGPNGVWVVSEPANLVVRIDPATNQHLEIPIDARPSAVAVTPDAVWVADGLGGRIIRIDPSNDRVLLSVSAGGRVDAISAGDQSGWVSVHGG
jgi:YVTN family beta-propeller protein